MKVDLNVDVHHLARIEGHGNIKVQVQQGQLTEARWDVVETPRFFEVMLKGQHHSAAALLSSRICGICSISHALTSLHATELAFGITVPPAALKLRQLAKHGETLQSHVLHLMFLAAPDLLGEHSVIPLVQSKPRVVALAARLKALGNRVCDVVAGRTTHPVSLQVGGVAVMPARKQLLALRDELARAPADLAAVTELLASLELPDFSRETEFVSLWGNGDYPYLGRELVSTDGVRRGAADYLQMTNEYVTEDNTSKWCRLSRETMAVGSLARFNNNHAGLRPEAAAVAQQLGLEAVCHNPFYNNLARLVECVQAAHDCIQLVDELLDEGGDAEIMAPVQPRAGEGTGAVEAPRGILYHHYVYDDQGRIERADCVIPTTQNNANIHHDLPALVQQFATAEMTDEKLELLCSMLVRAYDPCVSCSVH